MISWEFPLALCSNVDSLSWCAVHWPKSWFSIIIIMTSQVRLKTNFGQKIRFLIEKLDFGSMDCVPDRKPAMELDHKPNLTTELDREPVFGQIPTM